MEYKALVSFSGSPVSMAKDEVRVITDDAVVADLLRAKYIEAVPVKAKVKADKNESKRRNTK